MRKDIEEIINRKTKAWDTQDVDLFLSIFHEDMVWPWPKENTDHDPIDWELFLGKFDHKRWGNIYTDFFNKNRLIHNNREIKKIEISNEKDGAFAVVDIDTFWEERVTKIKHHWFGRVSKAYVKTTNGWKLIMHTGVLKY